MTHLLDFTPELYLNFFLVLVRVSGLFITAPIISAQNVPRPIRVYLIFMMSLVMANVVSPLHLTVNFSVALYGLLVLKELMIGLLLGIVPRVFFAAVDFAGSVIGFQMGFSMANVVDPQTQNQTSIIASFKTLVATLIFVTIDGHHYFIEALSASYDQIALGGFVFQSQTKVDYLITLMGEIFLVGLRLGAPIIVALLLANAILGFMARSMPQFNVFIVGFPLTITLGMLLLLITMPYIVMSMVGIFQQTGQGIVDLLSIMGK